jgi:hypothetical protein
MSDDDSQPSLHLIVSSFDDDSQPSLHLILSSLDDDSQPSLHLMMTVSHLYTWWWQSAISTLDDDSQPSLHLILSSLFVFIVHKINIEIFGCIALFRQPITLTAHYSDNPLLRQPITPTAHFSTMQNRTQSTNPWFNQVYPTGCSVGQANIDRP